MDDNKRYKLGVRAGVIGVMVNVFLAIFKLIIGLWTNSQAIIADGYNNLSDSINSVVTMMGFSLANKPADKEHPFGHGRVELIGGLVMSLVMGYIGVDTLISSIQSIFDSEHLVYNKWSYIVMLVAMIFKAGLAFIYKVLNKKVKSDVLKAGIQDSLNDCLISIGVIIGIIAQNVWGLNYVDGVVGSIIAVIILITSINLFREFASELIGKRANKDIVDKISKILDTQDILGYHDLMVHHYGHSIYASVHIELPSDLTLLQAHDIVDIIERDVFKQLKISLITHLDPINNNDPIIEQVEPIIIDVLHEINSNLQIHDLRYIHEKLMFDVVVPENTEYTDADLKIMINTKLKEKGCDYHTQIQFDHNYLIR